MSRWNVHQKLRAAIRRLAHFERRVWATHQRRTPAEKKANTTARNCLARAYFDAQDAVRFGSPQMRASAARARAGRAISRMIAARIIAPRPPRQSSSRPRRR